MVRIFYKYKQINVHNLVCFGSPSTTSYNDYRTRSINLQICSIFFNWKVTPFSPLNVQFSVIIANSGYRMVGFMAESSTYNVREFHEKCFNRKQFILRTVKAPNTFLRSFSETSPAYDVIKDMVTSQISHFSKSVFIFRVLLYHRLYKPNIKRKYPETNTSEH